jgi:hypothetical protein
MEASSGPRKSLSGTSMLREGEEVTADTMEETAGEATLFEVSGIGSMNTAASGLYGLEWRFVLWRGGAGHAPLRRIGCGRCGRVCGRGGSAGPMGRGGAGIGGSGSGSCEWSSS